MNNKRIFFGGEKINSNEVAIFWDYENVRVIAEGINVPLAEALILYAESIGHPHVKKVYCDWARINKPIIQALYSLGFDTIQVSMGKTNSVDVKLAVDCLDIANLHPSINYFLIITGDKDFIPVVNWLRAHKKKVIIISRAEIVSEHLLMSANDFISLEELSKMYKSLTVPKTEIKEHKALDFEITIECLLDTIVKLRDEGKSTRYGMVDNYMRSSQNFDYNGATSVLRPNKSGMFKSFSKLIEEAEKTGKVKTETVEGFKEIFRIEENPQEESEFTQLTLDIINKEHLNMIFNIIINTIQEGLKDSKTIYKTTLLDKFKVAREKGELPYFNRTLRNVLDILIDINFIILLKQPSGKIELAKDHDVNLEDYKEKAMKKLLLP